jgi:murein DD-endopeptidase MepM/ murein hydrolase activator NlpD
LTRFGKWFAGALVLLLGVFCALLLMPRGAADPETAKIAPVPAVPSRVGNTSAGGPSNLIVPVANVRVDALTDTYGDPRGQEGERGHGALDIMAPRGTPVLAAAGGTIEKIFESELGGHTIYIRSPDGGYVYYYAHLDAYAPGAKEGVYVSQGEQIGTVGFSGDADAAGPHLHFEIKRMKPGEAWHEGRGINPYPLLARKPVLASEGARG